MRRRLPALALAALAACAGGHPAAMHRRTSRVTDAGTFATVATTAPTTTTVLAPGPGTVAAELAAVESGVRDPSAAASVLDDLGRRQLTAYRLLAHHPDWFDQVARQVSDGLRSAVTHNFTAEVELQALTPPRTQLPPWRVLPPRPASDLLAWYHEADAATGVPWTYLAAVHLVETSFGRIHSPSTAGAVGPMQFLPATWARYGRGDITDDHDAIAAAARFLRANGGPVDMAAALFHYNRSPHYVRAVTEIAEVLAEDPRAYSGYYHWPVMVRLTTGDVVLPQNG